MLTNELADQLSIKHYGLLISFFTFFLPVFLLVN